MANPEDAISDEDLAIALKDEYIKVVTAAGDQAESLITSLDFNVLNPEVQQFIGSRMQFMANNVNATTKAELIKQLQSGLAGGENTEELVLRVKGVFTKAKESRAVAIARTETIASYNQGSQLAYEQSGVVPRKVWIATRDTRVRDGHLALDGVEVELKGTFKFPDDGTETPGPAQSGIAGQDINCRCAIAPVVQEPLLVEALQ